jgi:hypothetical protein
MKLYVPRGSFLTEGLALPDIQKIVAQNNDDTKLRMLRVNSLWTASDRTYALDDLEHFY